MKAIIILLSLAFVLTFILRSVGMDINNIITIGLLTGALLVFCEWSFLR